MDQLKNLLRIIKLKDMVIDAQAETIRYLMNSKGKAVGKLIMEELQRIKEIQELDKKYYEKEGDAE